LSEALVYAEITDRAHFCHDFVANSESQFEGSISDTEVNAFYTEAMTDHFHNRVNALCVRSSFHHHPASVQRQSGDR
jgi:hypothetical protein